MDVVGALVAAVDQHTAEGLADATARLVRTGVLRAGTRMPTVREVAAALHLSPTSVSAAWTVLTRAGVLQTEGRRGTFVVDQHHEPAAPRFWRSSRDVGGYAVDLGTGVPDTRLLPDLRAVLARLSSTATVENYLEPSVMPKLRRHLEDRWSTAFDVSAVAVVDGALDALDRTCRELVRHGDRVLVEAASLPTVYDIVDDHGGVAVGIPLDEHGMVPDDVARAIRTEKPRLVVLQPRAHNPTGISMSEERARDLAEILRGTDTMVFEDDHCGDVSWSPLVSMARWRPEHTVVTQSFSKSHGPDLRVAALAGPETFVHRLSVRRRLGPGWTSRLLQAVLLALFEDDEAVATVALARRAYHERRTALAEALCSRGVATGGSDGINLWVPVSDENDARRRLAKHDIGVAAGSPFELHPSSGHHVRVTCASLASGVDELADQLAAAAASRRITTPDRGVA